MATRRRRTWQNPWTTSAVMMLFSNTIVAAYIPNLPTSVFYTEQDKHKILYVLDPPSSAFPGGRLRGLGLSSRLTAGSLSTTVLSDPLPFLHDDSWTYTSTLRPDGTIAVYAGTCADGIQGSQYWIYMLDSTSSNGSGRWILQSMTVPAQNTSGPAYLASAISFSPNTSASDPSIYTFGGLCPSDNASVSTWTTDATYFNRPISIQPNQASGYSLAIGTSQGGPVAEAGLSITPLVPTYSNVSGTNVAQQNFLLLGGQSQGAFINMSQIALLSLPQLSWTFYPVNSPTVNTDLVRRDTAAIEPRTGHSAVLTQDGSKVVVFGGWVGDSTNAATPQLAILEIGEGFGGNGAWTWSSPSSVAFPISNVSGLYGHGATMLPGNIMMVAGGMSIAGSANSINDQALFFNATSGLWLSGYDVNRASEATESHSVSGTLATSSQKAGLGAGLPIGLIALGLVLLAVFLFLRRRDQKEKAREADVREKALRDGEIEDLFQVASGDYWNRTDKAPYHSPKTSGYDTIWERRKSKSNESPQHLLNEESPYDSLREAERTGYDLNVPSPSRGFRKGRHNYYQPVSRFEEQGPSNHRLPMLPIEEKDEDNLSIESKGQPAAENPFEDPPPRIQMPARTQQAPPKACSPAEERNREMQHWIRDWSAADIAMQSGRASPDKSERTISTLSEQSMRSNLSSVSAVTRSGRSLARIPNPFGTPPNASPTRGSDSGDSYRTPPSSRGRDVVSQGEALLGYARPPMASNDHLGPDFEPTFTRGQPVRTHSRLGGWVGTVRRAVLPSIASARTASLTSTTPAPLGGFVDTSDPSSYREAAVESATSSPTKPEHAMQSPPRRSVSDGGSFWSSKAGARDWGVNQARSSYRRHAPPRSPQHPASASRSEFGIVPSLERQGNEDDWDIEGASENRLVQVMFTVPREKLRVVNAEVESVDDSTEASSRRASAASHQASREEERDKVNE